jgi:hypothetical protein
MHPFYENRSFFTVIFDVLTAATMKIAVFWVVAPCSLVEVYQRFRGACCLHHRPNDRGSKHIWNVGKLLQDYTALQPRRQPPSLLYWQEADTKILFWATRVQSSGKTCVCISRVSWPCYMLGPSYTRLYHPNICWSVQIITKHFFSSLLLFSLS